MNNPLLFLGLEWHVSLFYWWTPSPQSWRLADMITTQKGSSLVGDGRGRWRVTGRSKEKQRDVTNNSCHLLENQKRRHIQQWRIANQEIEHKRQRYTPNSSLVGCWGRWGWEENVRQQRDMWVRGWEPDKTKAGYLVELWVCYFASECFRKFALFYINSSEHKLVNATCACCGIRKYVM